MLSKFIYSFPVQLLANNLKRNPVLILCWLILFAIVTGNFGNMMGIPFLFLDPEYLNETDFVSFLILGITCGGFTMAFHISCYISDGPRYSFLGGLRRPFTRFCVNNSIIPFLFITVFSVQVVLFHQANNENGVVEVLEKIGGLCTGFILMLTLLFSYFKYTNKDIFKYITSNLDKKIKKVKVTRVNVMNRLKIAQNSKYRVDYYLDLNLSLKKVEEQSFHYDRVAILKIFDQNHLNSIIVEVFIFVILIILGIFRDNPYFQIPAAASLFLFLTIMLMIAGALNFWMRKWALLVAMIFFLFFNFFMKHEYVQADYHAFGLNYEVPPVEYSLNSLNDQVEAEVQEKDKNATLEILINWRKKFPSKEKPKMIFICTSGGGQRAALWTLKSLQFADSLTQGQLMKNTMLITGSSGGIMGAAYYREIYYRSLSERINKFEDGFTENISKDVLNPVIFSLLVNDFFIGFQKFKYQGFSYSKDRGYAFEQKFNYKTFGDT